MGLDISTIDSQGNLQEEIWSGSYMLFMRFRMSFLSALGGSFARHTNLDLNPDLWYWEDDKWGKLCNYLGIQHFFNHSDCDGESSQEECRAIATDFALFLDQCPELVNMEGVFSRDGYSMKQTIQKFIDLCSVCEGLEWH